MLIADILRQISKLRGSGTFPITHLARAIMPRLMNNKCGNNTGRVGEEVGLKGTANDRRSSPLLGTGRADFPHPARMATLTHRALTCPRNWIKPSFWRW
jgi:hypothetical protein